MKDREIISGFRQNDPETLSYAYKTLAPAVFKYVLANSGTQEEAKDVFQESCLRVLIRIKDARFDPQCKFEAYFFTVARNTWIDHLREKQKQNIVGNDDLLWQQADESDEDAKIRLLLHDRRLEALDQAWNSWDDSDCQRILRQFHFEQIRVKDIALNEKIAQNTVLQRLYKCRVKLFRLVSKHIDKTE
jgi:RNA polymerase sigma factor (sigma-70 family)